MSENGRNAYKRPLRNIATFKTKRADGLTSKSALTPLPMQINKKAKSC